jgi:hypothetical protein
MLYVCKAFNFGVGEIADMTDRKHISFRRRKNEFVHINAFLHYFVEFSGHTF